MSDFRPEREPAPQAERSFWNRGGTGLVLSGLVATVGTAAILSNPVGWAAALAAVLAASAGGAGLMTSFVQLGDSYFGGASPEQDAAANRATNAVLGYSSPGGFVGAVAGTAATGNAEGMEAGAFWGGLGEGVLLLSTGVSRIGLREWRFGPTRPNMNWDRVRPINQRAFNLVPGQVPTRPNPAFARGIDRIELSHWIPKKPRSGTWGRVRQSLGDQRYWSFVNRPWNLKPMWGIDHALVDAERFAFLRPPAIKEALRSQQWQGLSRFVRLTPPSILESSLGAAKIGVSFGADRDNPGRFSSLYQITMLDSDIPTSFGSSEEWDDPDVDILVPDGDYDFRF